MIKLSILIPVYNSERYIARCLDSLVDQNLEKEEFEIIIFNDGSTDSSKIIVENYIKKYDNIRLYSESNSGVYSARNKLLTLAKGAFVYFMDVDDYIIKNCLGDLIKLATQNDLEVLAFDTLIIEKIEEENAQSIPLNIDDIPKVQDGFSVIGDVKVMRSEIWWYIINVSSI